MSCVGKQDLIQIQENQNIVFDLRYATTNNFTNTQIYLEEKVFIHKNTLKDFKCVVKKAQQQGYKIKIFDAWRPYEAQEFLFSIVNNPDFVSPPTGTCGHCRGMAIDLTLINKKTNQEVDMGTEFDDFTTKAYANANEITEEQKQNRQILQNIMQSCNYEIYNYEWWHFNHKDLHKIEKYRAGNLIKINTIKLQKRIAITGTHGVGKTTILSKVKAKNKDIEIIEEQFRVVQKRDKFKQQTENISIKIGLEQAEIENKIINNGKSFLADRTIIDSIIYQNFFDLKLNNIKLDNSLIDEAQALLSNKDSDEYTCDELVKRYDKIYLIMPSKRKIENDNFRMTNKKEQLLIGKLFFAYFGHCDNVVVFNQEQQDEVVELILKDYE